MTIILAIDQGTTSSRAMLFDDKMNVMASAQQEFTQYFPQSGWVEHDGEELWQSVMQVCKKAMDGHKIAAIGITNQRETVMVWERDTGKPIHRAIVWQDRRTSDFCNKLKAEGHEEMISQTTGLLLDPYFSATKLAWLLDNVDGARQAAQKGKLAFGTIDSFLIWRLTQGKHHVTDATNAARTMLYDINKGEWSKEICALLDIPMTMLPEVKNCADDFGKATALDGQVILGVAGDQQAATMGQACFNPGMMKSTYGTGCFALLNNGEKPVLSRHKLLTTIAYQLKGKPIYALEGSIFIAGAVVQWLRDGLSIIKNASETQIMAEHADETQNLIMVPAFTGLGAPYWQAEARGGIFGLTRNSGPNEFAKAALQSIGYQTRDLLKAMQADWPNAKTNILRVDGGMSASDYTMQFLADICTTQVERPPLLETTALGAAWLAGMQAGIYPEQDEFAKQWRIHTSFKPNPIDPQYYANWQRAVQAVMVV